MLCEVVEGFERGFVAEVIFGGEESVLDGADIF